MDIFFSIRSWLCYRAPLLWKVSSFRLLWYFPVLVGNFKSHFAVSKSLVEFTFLSPIKVISTLLWSSLRPGPAHLKFRVEQTDLREEEHTASQD